MTNSKRKYPTDKEIAARCGITNVWLCKILKGKIENPKLETVKKIVENSEGKYTVGRILPGLKDLIGL